jgi:protein-disulfide isomerase
LPLLVAAFRAGARKAAKPAKPAQEPAGITRDQADEILSELRQIRQLLEKQQQPAEPAVKRAKLDLTGFQMLGSKDAPITMVEFTDYQCPYCQRFHVATFGDIKKNYIDTGRVRFYSRDLPLVSLHTDALRAAQASRCAAEQNQFWTLRDRMVAAPDKLDMNSLAGFAGELKMDVNAFRTCVESGKYIGAITSDVKRAQQIGATGTPTFVIGKSTPEGVDGELIEGALPYQAFDEKLKELENVK